jgi:hypothetical protein
MSTGFMARTEPVSSPQLRQKGRYFSVRFSAQLLARIDAARAELYGNRATRAETIRRLLDQQLNEIASLVDAPRRAGYVHNRVVVPWRAAVEADAEPGCCAELGRCAEPYCRGRLKGCIREAIREMSRAVMALESLMSVEESSDSKGGDG